MSTNKMLIDAAHPEEIRVAVLSGNRLQDFDVESVARKQNKGNIYLAKVIRVEPSLQAAFVDYGGNRHGFLSFSEIHPDYYQIPIEDRQALLAEHEAAEMAEELDEEEVVEDEEDTSETTDSDDAASAADLESVPTNEIVALESDEAIDAVEAVDIGSVDPEEDIEGAAKNNRKGIETIGGDDTDEERPRRRPQVRRYKIQEVIKRRQILLIQVVKEERGNKGAALTTYISLAGRYCVLMPNTARGGGISRKITNGGDRKHLKSILADLKIPEGMAVIVRTAGIKRSKAEIKRDYEYLTRLWDSIRELTLESTAPCLVHEEGNLIKRSIRDLYTRDIEEIIVAGDQGYRMAKDFIKLLIPSHAKRVQPYTGASEPIFQHYMVESQLDAIHSPEVQLKSGAYIVINPTEALVSIDVNSGRSTRERNIEETAYKTNLEAADEIARQLRLRDLAGLIVIDFIDMEVNRNNVQVEKRLKDAMRNDRARIQIGRISPFGLLEMSRQRLRMSLLETSSEPCPFCAGTGIRRSTDSAALVALRAIQEEANHQHAHQIIVHVPTAVALYILNQKRPNLAEIEQSTGTSVIIAADESLIPPDFRIERVRASGKVETVASISKEPDISADEKPSKRRRRPRRRKSSDVDQDVQEAQTEVEETAQEEDGEARPSKRRRRGKRGGRRRRGRSDEQENAEENVSAAESDSPDADAETETSAEADDNTPVSATDSEEMAQKDEAKPPRRRSRTKKVKAEEENEGTTDDTAEDKEASKSPSKPKRAKAKDKAEKNDEEKPKRKPRSRRKPEEPAEVKVQDSDAAPEKVETAIKDEPPKADLREVDKELIAEAAKTTVINIGKDKSTDDKPKRGWWRR